MNKISRDHFNIFDKQLDIQSMRISGSRSRHVFYCPRQMVINSKTPIYGILWEFSRYDHINL